MDDGNAAKLVLQEVFGKLAAVWAHNHNMLAFECIKRVLGFLVDHIEVQRVGDVFEVKLLLSPHVHNYLGVKASMAPCREGKTEPPELKREDRAPHVDHPRGLRIK